MGYCKAVGPHNISFELVEILFIYLEIVEKCLSCCIYLHTILDDNWSRLWIYLFHIRSFSEQSISLSVVEAKRSMFTMLVYCANRHVHIPV
jgi:hypothetical protein